MTSALSVYTLGCNYQRSIILNYSRLPIERRPKARIATVFRGQEGIEWCPGRGVASHNERCATKGSPRREHQRTALGNPGEMYAKWNTLETPRRDEKTARQGPGSLAAREYVERWIAQTRETKENAERWHNPGRDAQAAMSARRTHNGSPRRDLWQGDDEGWRTYPSPRTEAQEKAERWNTQDSPTPTKAELNITPRRCICGCRSNGVHVGPIPRISKTVAARPARCTCHFSHRDKTSPRRRALAEEVDCGHEAAHCNGGEPYDHNFHASRQSVCRVDTDSEDVELATIENDKKKLEFEAVTRCRTVVIDEETEKTLAAEGCGTSRSQKHDESKMEKGMTNRGQRRFCTKPDEGNKVCGAKERGAMLDDERIVIIEEVQTMLEFEKERLKTCKPKTKGFEQTEDYSSMQEYKQEEMLRNVTDIGLHLQEHHICSRGASPKKHAEKMMTPRECLRGLMSVSKFSNRHDVAKVEPSCSCNLPGKDAEKMMSLQDQKTFRTEALWGMMSSGQFGTRDDVPEVGPKSREQLNKFRLISPIKDAVTSSGENTFWAEGRLATISKAQLSNRDVVSNYRDEVTELGPKRQEQVNESRRTSPRKDYEKMMSPREDTVRREALWSVTGKGQVNNRDDVKRKLEALKNYTKEDVKKRQQAKERKEQIRLEAKEARKKLFMKRQAVDEEKNREEVWDMEVKEEASNSFLAKEVKDEAKKPVLQRKDTSKQQEERAMALFEELRKQEVRSQEAEEEAQILELLRKEAKEEAVKHELMIRVAREEVRVQGLPLPLEIVKKTKRKESPSKQCEEDLLQQEIVRSTEMKDEAKKQEYLRRKVEEKAPKQKLEATELDGSREEGEETNSKEELHAVDVEAEARRIREEGARTRESVELLKIEAAVDFLKMESLRKEEEKEKPKREEVRATLMIEEARRKELLKREYEELAQNKDKAWAIEVEEARRRVEMLRKDIEGNVTKQGFQAKKVVLEVRSKVMSNQIDAIALEKEIEMRPEEVWKGENNKEPQTLDETKKGLAMVNTEEESMQRLDLLRLSTLDEDVELENAKQRLTLLKREAVEGAQRQEAESRKQMEGNFAEEDRTLNSKRIWNVTLESGREKQIGQRHEMLVTKDTKLQEEATRRQGMQKEVDRKVWKEEERQRERPLPRKVDEERKLQDTRRRKETLKKELVEEEDEYVVRCAGDLEEGLVELEEYDKILRHESSIAMAEEARSHVGTYECRNVKEKKSLGRKRDKEVVQSDEASLRGNGGQKATILEMVVDNDETEARYQMAEAYRGSLTMQADEETKQKTKAAWLVFVNQAELEGEERRIDLSLIDLEKTELLLTVPTSETPWRLEQSAILDKEVAVDQARHEATRTDFLCEAADDEVRRQEAKEEGLLESQRENLQQSFIGKIERAELQQSLNKEVEKEKEMYLREEKEKEMYLREEKAVTVMVKGVKKVQEDKSTTVGMIRVDMLPSLEGSIPQQGMQDVKDHTLKKKGKVQDEPGAKGLALLARQQSDTQKSEECIFNLNESIPSPKYVNQIVQLQDLKKPLPHQDKDVQCSLYSLANSCSMDEQNCSLNTTTSGNSYVEDQQIFSTHSTTPMETKVNRTWEELEREMEAMAKKFKKDLIEEKQRLRWKMIEKLVNLVTMDDVGAIPSEGENLVKHAQLARAFHRLMAEENNKCVQRHSAERHKMKGGKNIEEDSNQENIADLNHKYSRGKSHPSKKLSAENCHKTLGRRLKDHIVRGAKKSWALIRHRSKTCVPEVQKLVHEAMQTNLVGHAFSAQVEDIYAWDPRKRKKLRKKSTVRFKQDLIDSTYAGTSPPNPTKVVSHKKVQHHDQQFSQTYASPKDDLKFKIQVEDCDFHDVIQEETKMSQDPTEMKGTQKPHLWLMNNKEHKIVAIRANALQSSQENSSSNVTKGASFKVIDYGPKLNLALLTYKLVDYKATNCAKRGAPSRRVRIRGRNVLMKPNLDRQVAELKSGVFASVKGHPKQVPKKTRRKKNKKSLWQKITYGWQHIGIEARKQGNFTHMWKSASKLLIKLTKNGDSVFKKQKSRNNQALRRNRSIQVSSTRWDSLSWNGLRNKGRTQLFVQQRVEEDYFTRLKVACRRHRNGQHELITSSIRWVKKKFQVLRKKSKEKRVELVEEKQRQTVTPEITESLRCTRSVSQSPLDEQYPKFLHWTYSRAMQILEAPLLITGLLSGPKQGYATAKRFETMSAVNRTKLPPELPLLLLRNLQVDGSGKYSGKKKQIISPREARKIGKLAKFGLLHGMFKDNRGVSNKNLLPTYYSKCSNVFASTSSPCEGEDDEEDKSMDEKEFLFANKDLHSNSITPKRVLQKSTMMDESNGSYANKSDHESHNQMLENIFELDHMRASFSKYDGDEEVPNAGTSISTQREVRVIAQRCYEGPVETLSRRAYLWGSGDLGLRNLVYETNSPREQMCYEPLSSRAMDVVDSHIMPNSSLLS